MRSLSCLLLLFVALPTSAAPQTPALPHAAESVEVSIVNVDVVVADKQGKRVPGLLRDDFEIFENGVRQPITNFAEYTSAPPQQQSGAVTTQVPAAAPQSPPSQQRSIVVFVERFQLPAFRSDPMFAAMKKLLHDSVRPGDRVMVVSWNQGILGVRQTFTDNLAKVDAALDALARRTVTLNRDQMDDLRQELSTITDVFGNGEQSIADSVSFSREQSARMKAQIAMADEKRKVETLNALMRSMGGADGRKMLLLATHRLSEFAGAEAYYLAGTEQLPLDVQSEFDAKPLMRTLVETANANGVTIYPIYAEGLGSTTMPSGDQADAPSPGGGAFDYRILSNETPMLDYVAKETGGMSAWGSTEVAKLLPRIGDDFDSYYSLAYRATPGKAAARKIEVRVKDPKLSVRSRGQFVPKTESTRMDDRVIGALFGNAPRSAFRFAAKIGEPSRTKNKTYLFPLTVQVPIGALTPLRGQGNVYNGAFSVYVAWGSTIGGVSETHHDTQPFSIPAGDLDRAKTGHFTYTVSVESLTPSLRVSVGVYDEVSRDYSVGLVKPPPMLAK